MRLFLYITSFFNAPLPFSMSHSCGAARTFLHPKPLFRKVGPLTYTGSTTNAFCRFTEHSSAEGSHKYPVQLDEKSL